MKTTKVLHMIAFVLVIIGGVNWLLVGILGDKDLFVLLGMNMGDIIPKIIYILVGLSAIYLAVTHKSACKVCMSAGGGQGTIM